VETEKSLLEEGNVVIEVVHVHGAPPPSDEPQILAIGKFDGVHVGHQEILRQARAKGGTGKVAVMSFWPHPAWALAGKVGYDKSLTPEAEQARLLEQLGVDRLYRVQFSHEYARTSAEVFVQNHLAALQVCGVVVGVDFRFGQGGLATTSDLATLCKPLGAPVYVVSPIEANGVKVSSSQVRRHLQHGRVEAAESLLNRPYAVVGDVVHGQALGRQIGFPTANLSGIDAYVLPAQGVYAVAVQVLGERESTWFGVLNAGVRPTVDGRKFQLEVHLLDFDGDLYGHSIRVSFLHRLRDEQRFDGIDGLTAQIARDVETARDMFAQLNPIRRTE